MSRVREAVFWSAAGGAAWVLAGYPALLALLPPRPWRRGGELPSVTVVVPAFREREPLRRKLEALRELDYPPERLEVIVAVDEDEKLAGIARSAHPGALVLFSPRRAGKAAGLNRALARAGGEVVLLTDANNVLERGSVRAAVRHFADPRVGAVAGRRGETGSAYERYEDAIRRLESRSGSVAALSGELVALRASLAPRFPEDVVNDDFWLLCQLVRAGWRVVYEPAAASTEPALGARAELARRTRMGAGRVLLAGELPGLPAGFAFRVASHKLGRLALPFLLLGAAGGALSLARRRPYSALAALQLAAYAPGLASLAGFTPPGPAGAAARASRQLLLGSLASAAGLVRGLRRRQPVRWDPVR